LTRLGFLVVNQASVGLTGPVVSDGGVRWNCWSPGEP
jgi:hypothetical protein